MDLRRTLAVLVVVMPWLAAPALAQFQPTQPLQAPQQAAPQQPPCLKDFLALRDDAGKKAKAIQEAQKHKASVSEACKLLTIFTAAQAKMLKYAQDNATWCGIPPQIIQEITAGHKDADTARARICKIAANPPRPRGPTMSDMLGASNIPDANNIKTGRGTFDTLTGTPLGK
ncbi:MAG TPA: hypothetical protein VHD14_12105 [Pseudolabrys sp.]|jgi:hypothetical protein|nr:hypothetical protein [Pseudolabrys sp.]